MQHISDALRRAAKKNLEFGIAGKYVGLRGQADSCMLQKVVLHSLLSSQAMGGRIRTSAAVQHISDALRRAAETFLEFRTASKYGGLRGQADFRMRPNVVLRSLLLSQA